MTVDINKPLEHFVYLNSIDAAAWVKCEILKQSSTMLVTSYFDGPGYEQFTTWNIGDLQDKDYFRNEDRELEPASLVKGKRLEVRPVKEEKWLVTYEGAGYASKEEAEKWAEDMQKINPESTLIYRVYKVVEE